jgi:hypothetical protein
VDILQGIYFLSLYSYKIIPTFFFEGIGTRAFGFDKRVDQVKSENATAFKKEEKNEQQSQKTLYLNLMATPKTEMWLEKKTYLSVGHTAIMLLCK